MREQQVLDKIQKIWSDMALMKQEINHSKVFENGHLQLEAHLSSTS